MLDLSPQKVAWVDFMITPLKKEAQNTLPCPQQRVLPDELDKNITWGAAMVGEKVWDLLVT